MLQNPGVGLGSIRFLGSEWVWVAILATVVIAVFSLTRVSVVSVGWSWGAKPGHVRLRLLSFSSMSDGSIVTASGMFSAKMLSCSSDSCNEAASNSSTCASEAASKVAAEMFFIFEKKTSPCSLLPKKEPFAGRVLSEKIVLRRTKSAGSRTIADKSLLVPLQRIGSTAPVVKREGVDWDVSPAFLPSRNADYILLFWAQSLTEPFACTAPPSLSCTVSKPSSYEWDPLLKLRIRDAVFSDRHPVYQLGETGSLIRTSRANDVVRLWDSKTESTLKMLHLPNRFSGVITVFDVNWEPKVAVLGNVGGLVCIANLVCPTFEKIYQTYHSVMQCVHLDRSEASNTLFTGGPVTANPGCTVSLWDRRANSRQMSLNLSSASTFYGIGSQDHELYVRDGAVSLVVHDVRMLSPSCLRRVPCDLSYESASNHRWRDVAVAVKAANGDVDAEFWNYQAANVGKTTSVTCVGSVVAALSRNLTVKSPSM